MYRYTQEQYQSLLELYYRIDGLSTENRFLLKFKVYDLILKAEKSFKKDLINRGIL